MKEFFKNGFKLETESLKSLNEAYYETDDRLKRSKCQTAKITTKAALKRLQGDYFHKPTQPRMPPISIGGGIGEQRGENKCILFTLN